MKNLKIGDKCIYSGTKHDITGREVVITNFLEERYSDMSGKKIGVWVVYCNEGDWGNFSCMDIYLDKIDDDEEENDIKWWKDGKLEEKLKNNNMKMENLKSFEEYMYRPDPSKKAERTAKSKDWFVKKLSSMGEDIKKLTGMSIAELGKLYAKKTKK